MINKLMLKSDAAEKVGVTRQTIQNWIDRGLIGSRRIGRAVYVSEEEMERLTDIAADSEKVRKELQDRKDEHRRLLLEEERMIHELRDNLRVLPKYTSAFARNDFYLSVIYMLGDVVSFPQRDIDILRMILEGYSIDLVSREFGLTRERIRQIAANTARRCGTLIDYKKVCDENDVLRKRNKENEQVIRDQERKIRGLETRLGIKTSRTLFGKERIRSVLATRVLDVSMSVRLSNILISNGLDTLADVVRLPKDEIIQLRHMGRKSFEELVDIIDKYGLEFGLDTGKYI